MSDMHRWISALLDAQSAEQGSARNTLLAYGRDLKDFAGWLAQHGRDFDKASQQDVEAYLIFCSATGLSKATRARRLSAIRQLFRFAHDEGWRADNPALRLKGPGRDVRLPGTLDHAEVDAIIEAAKTFGRANADRKRNGALLELLYATGMRVSELVELPVQAVRGAPRMILVRGKGDKERMVPLSPPAMQAVSEWLGIRDEADDLSRLAGKPASKYLFPGPRRRRTSVAPAFLFADQRHCSGGRRAARQGDAAHPAPCFCHASIGRRCRPSGHTNAAGPCRYRHHRNLHSCAG